MDPPKCTCSAIATMQDIPETSTGFYEEIPEETSEQLKEYEGEETYTEKDILDALKSLEQNINSLEDTDENSKVTIDVPGSDVPYLAQRTIEISEPDNEELREMFVAESETMFKKPKTNVLEFMTDADKEELRQIIASESEAMFKTSKTQQHSNIPEVIDESEKEEFRQMHAAEAKALEPYLKEEFKPLKDEPLPYAEDSYTTDNQFFRNFLSLFQMFDDEQEKQKVMSTLQSLESDKDSLHKDDEITFQRSEYKRRQIKPTSPTLQFVKKNKDEFKKRQNIVEENLLQILAGKKNEKAESKITEVTSSEVSTSDSLSTNPTTSTNVKAKELSMEGNSSEKVVIKIRPIKTQSMTPTSEHKQKRFATFKPDQQNDFLEVPVDVDMPNRSYQFPPVRFLDDHHMAAGHMAAYRFHNISNGSNELVLNPVSFLQNQGHVMNMPSNVNNARPELLRNRRNLFNSKKCALFYAVGVIMFFIFLLMGYYLYKYFTS